MSDAEAFALLTPRQRQIMQLVRRGHDAAEISGRLGVSRAAVYVMLSIARKRIRAKAPPAPSHAGPDLSFDEATVCQFGHAKTPGYHCYGCMRAEKLRSNPVLERARVAREIAQGKRCTRPMRSGAPCGLLLPCVHE